MHKNDLARIENWIDDLGLGAIRESDPVQRLKSVRFLGTMKYVTDLTCHYSRYDHTMRVAELAYAMGIQVELSSDDLRLGVLSALLHDIGHLPFSHASEVFFRRSWGKYHTGHGSRLNFHLAKALELEGNKKLSQDVKVARLYLREHKTVGESFRDIAFYEIFHGALSADTLDGIVRAAESIGLAFPDPMSIISGIFRADKSLFITAENQVLIRQFLRLKREIYVDYVYSARGMAAEAMLTRALELTFSEFKYRNEFLSLDDNDALERLWENNRSRLLMEALESNELFYSLREVTSDKHRLVVELMNRLQGSREDQIALTTALEDVIAKKLKVTDAACVIFHRTIQHGFSKSLLIQETLPTIPISLASIGREHGSMKAYGQAIEVFFPRENIDNIKNLSIPTSLEIPGIPESDEESEKRITSLERHRGAYMTPARIAQFLSSWAILTSEDQVIDPSSGEGVFLRAASERLVELGKDPTDVNHSVFGIESDPNYCAELIKNWSNGVTFTCANVINDDFFQFVAHFVNSKEEKHYFDAIIGNPPYIRSHRFQGEARQLALQVSESIGVRLSNRVSSWAPYVVCSIALLKETGRLAMVLPTEILSTEYALPVRNFLNERFKSLTFVLFNKLLFGPVQQDVVLLLASNDQPYGIKRINTTDDKTLSYELLASPDIIQDNPSWLTHKWTNLIADQSVLHLIDALLNDRKLCQLGELASISLGQVTGNNNFFLLSPKDIAEWNISNEWLVPIVAKASVISGAALRKQDRITQEQRNERCYMLRISSTSNIASDRELQRYLEYGKRIGADQGYKCRTRWPWYSIPMQQSPDAFLTYMSGNIVRLVLNFEKTNSTNTIHNVQFKDDIGEEMKRAIVVSFYSSLAMVSMEIVGRVYGGGVLKLELREARNVILPQMEDIPTSIVSQLARLFDDLDTSLRSGSSSIFEEIDRLVLCQALGLNCRDRQLIAAERDRLRARRMLRYQ